MKFTRMSDAHRHLIKTIAQKVDVVDAVEGNEDFELAQVADNIQMTYARFTEWLRREYPGAKEWDASSLSAAIEPWSIRSWPAYAKCVRHPARTCQRYAVNCEDYRLFCGQFVACQKSADQFGIELDAGIRGNRPKRYTDVS